MGDVPCPDCNFCYKKIRGVIGKDQAGTRQIPECYKYLHPGIN
jgi:hypothetical protein